MDVKHYLPTLHRDLERSGVEYAICGGIALWPYNCERHTQDIDILVSTKTAVNLRKLITQGYVWDLEYPRTLKMLTGGAPVEIDILIESYGIPGTAFVPSNVVANRNKINGVWFVTKAYLIEMKSASTRAQDEADVACLQSEDL